MLRILTCLLIFSFIFNPVIFAQQKEDNIWDFGVVKENIVLKHEFTLTNNTDKPLLIRDVITSCGCTATKIKKKRLLPGESTPLEVTFETEGYSGETKQNIYVHTDNQDSPIIKFTIKANVVK